MPAESRPPSDTEALSAVLVTLLMNDAEVTTDVLLRDLGCLADAGWLQFEQQDSATPMVRIVRHPSDDDDLRFSERVALYRVEQQAGKQPDVPLSAVLDREGTDAQEWWGRYADAIHGEARAAGLTWKAVSGWRFGAAAAATGAVSGVATRSAGGGIGLSLLVAVFVSVFPANFLLFALTRPVLTRAGRRALRQAQNQQDDSVLGSGSLIPEVTPLPRHQAWSAFGGRWHIIAVPHGSDPARERRALESARSEVRGQVLRRWSTSHWTGGQSTGTMQSFHHCCIDDGVSDEGWTFSLSDRQFQDLTAGDVVAIGIELQELRFIHEPTEGTDTRRA